MSVLSFVAQMTNDYSYSYSTSSSSNDAAGAVLGFVFLVGIFLLLAAFYVFTAVCLSKIFKKAGRTDSWAAWVPVYNSWVYYEVAGKPGWWAFLGFISIVNLVVSIIGSISLAEKFGKDTGFGVLLALVPFIGLPMLAFGNAQYIGEAGPAAPAPTNFPQNPQQPIV